MIEVICILITLLLAIAWSLLFVLIAIESFKDWEIMDWIMVLLLPAIIVYWIISIFFIK